MYRMAPTKSIISILSSALFLLSTHGLSANAVSEEGFEGCLAREGVNNFTSSHSNGFDSLLKFSIQNLRFAGSNVQKPSFLILPRTKREVQAAVKCCRREGYEIRARSGGHSYEGISSTAEAPFVIIDLMHLNAVIIDVPSATAWIEGGATLGEIYYTIAQATGDYGFSAGSCPTVGSGGHISGGGFGFLSRKYGLAADNVVDAEVVDAMGMLLNRAAMGEDLFWALRGGGGGSWGIVVAWKIKLLKVPPAVTAFGVDRSGVANMTDLLYKWQTVAPNLERDFYLSVYLAASDETTVAATFSGLYLGPATKMLKSINSRFPELGIKPHDCKEMRWIEAVLFFSGRGPNTTSLLDRYDSNKNYFYGKSDYVRNPIPKSAIKGAFKLLQQQPNGYLIMDPYGGKMKEIPSDSTPFPHRVGNLFDIQYIVEWYDDNGNDEIYIGWLRKLYQFMEPYVSKNPRAAYVNYMDLDLGSMANISDRSSLVERAAKWGKKYFLHNFERLVRIKTRVDPHNVFRNVQSIPPVVHI
ncbi:hypothetical protein KI387_015668 [Taxus chinensis]|uniref:FAD-binding PCMH-type domain-containing protein n=1 Tax=Taxus chinensis TaxID=29808 RepID=A0AA38GG93_TAXCH|nr:hypothetical protein KI387_015668 [Taxus chinensis]